MTRPHWELAWRTEKVGVCTSLIREISLETLLASRRSVVIGGNKYIRAGERKRPEV